ncbi:MAG: CHASE2 domain-containing serine/threonine-protein kinase [Phenylobacterium sp.]
MSRSSSAKRRQFWRSDWLVGACIVAAVLVPGRATGLFEALERRFYDIASTQSSRQPSDRIAVIAIDDQSIANIGRWPWPRDVQAELVDKLAGAKAKTIVNTTLFLEPQTDRGLVFLRKIKGVLGASGPGGQSSALGKVIAEAEASLDADGRLVASMARAGNVLVASAFVLGEPLGRPDQELPAPVARSSVDDKAGLMWPSTKGLFPIEDVAQAADGVGHLAQTVDPDGAVRAEPLLVNYYGRAIPSLALLAAARSLNLGAADIRILPDEGVQLGRLRIRADATGRIVPQFYGSRDGRPPFAVDSFYDVLSGKIPAAKYADRIVIIGATAQGVGTSFPVPGYRAISPAEMMAHVTSNILSEHFIVQPAWSGLATFAAFLLVAGYVLAGLPRLSAGVAACVTAGLLLTLLGTEYVLLASGGIWQPLVLPAALLVIGHAALTTRRFLVTEAGKARSDEESAETNRMMGLALQGQGQLDMAFDRFRRVPMSVALLDNLDNLALDFERKRQFNKAQAMYEHMAAFDRGYKDLQSKLNRARNLSETVILGGAGNHPGGTLLLDGGAVEKPMLGRYQVEKELGKGAMGVVYLGRDPKIGRVVAIKTMALSQEFEAEELDDARQRFFREAETAGRLQHQNIVTIFDAGEEHDLAYIAMEFLRGKDLVDFCRQGALLPVPRVLSIVARVAEALAYAHRQNVVHRDIKPANVMYDIDSDTVKVTDFGIARITDASRTRTGLVLGTPSYMSPEQIAGKKVDGRSDLYSLGVMLHQLLTGVLPFRGDSMAELMYRIANEPAADIRAARSDLPEPLARAVARSLAKMPEDRYQDGDAFAAGLRALLGLPEGGAVTAGAHDGRAAVSLASAALAQAEAEKTMRIAAATPATAMSGHASATGYDAAAQGAPAGDGSFARTAVLGRPEGDARPAGGTGRSDSEA